MPNRPLCFVDVETTGLDPHRHNVWEWAVIIDGEEHHGQVRLAAHQIKAADDVALDVGQWWDRYDHAGANSPSTAAARIVALTEGVTLVGAQPHFDAAFLRALLVEEGQTPSWHHRFLDVESMGAAALGWPAPRSLSDTARALGVELDGRPRHTALEDARLARDVHTAAIAGSEPTLLEVPA